jgi:hypothetical protein
MTSDIEQRLSAVEDALEMLQQERADQVARNRRASTIRIIAFIALGALYYFYVSQSLSGL